MSYKVFARDCETMPDLTAWAVGHIPTASLHLLDGEVIIHTGMTVEMNGELMPLSDVEEESLSIRWWHLIESEPIFLNKPRNARGARCAYCTNCEPDDRIGD